MKTLEELRDELMEVYYIPKDESSGLLERLRAAEQRGIEKCGESIQVLIDGLPPIVDRLNRESENSSQRRSRSIRSNFILCLTAIRALAQGGE